MKRSVALSLSLADFEPRYTFCKLVLCKSAFVKSSAYASPSANVFWYTPVGRVLSIEDMTSTVSLCRYNLFPIFNVKYRRNNTAADNCAAVLFDDKHSTTFSKLVLASSRFLLLLFNPVYSSIQFPDSYLLPRIQRFECSVRVDNNNTFDSRTVCCRSAE